MNKQNGYLCVWLLSALAAAPLAHAASFDETLKAPAAASSPAALRTSLRGHFTRFEDTRKTQSDGFIRDASAYRNWVELDFSVSRALDEKRALGDLSQFGFVANADGSFTVNLKDHPQWSALDERLLLLRDPDAISVLEPQLRARGFSEADLAALRNYVATHDADQIALANGKDLIETYANRLQRNRRGNQTLDVEEAWSFRYQKYLVRMNARRQWAIGLLDALDKQPQRILASLFEELDSTRTYIAEQEPPRVSLEREVQPLLSGEYAQEFERQQRAAQKTASVRAQKLLETAQ